MKRMTPLKAKKHPSEMERYVKERQMRAKTAKPAPMVTTLSDVHDPESDLHYLTRAQEVMRDPGRHRAAKKVAKAKIKNLSSIA